MRFASTRVLLSALIAVATALPATLPLPSARAATFSDVQTSTRYAAAIQALKERGVIAGYADGTFKPGADIARGEFLKIVLESRGQVDIEASDCFPDVRDEWFAKYVCTAKDEGIIAGYPDGRFRPDQPISFVESAKILSLAFAQSPQGGGGEWYEPYARALEDSKAIPTSIAALDHRVQRGEMAQMLWILTERKTDQPTKGYLNLKNPELTLNTASDEVQMPKSCGDLAAFAASSQQNGYYGYGNPMLMRGTTDAAGPGASMEAKTTNAAPTAPQASDGDYSQTNVQVAGVDEADIVKTDGNNVYIVHNNTVRIVKVTPSSAMDELATISINDESFYPRDLYVDGNRLVILGTSQGAVNRPMPMLRADPASAKMIAPGYWPQWQEWSQVRIYDISDPKKPRSVREISFEGSTVSSRRIDDRVYLVVRRNMPYFISPLAKTSEDGTPLLPQFRDSDAGDKAVDTTRCGSVQILPHIVSPSYIVVASIPTDGDGDVEREVILGNGENIYASTDNLYVSQTEWSYSWDVRAPQSTERTRIFRFAIDEGDVAFKAQGTVPGHIKNQFSMDEHNGDLRVTTTKSQSWDMNRERPSTNNLYVLDADLSQLGKIEDIAPGETIYSTRFLGDRAYMVTFQKIDPFFVIDVADPRNPKILGKLKIPGYSDYLHPYDEDHVIGFGKDAVVAKEGDFAWYQGMKVAIFDVRDVENPKELHKIAIGDRGTDSPLLSDHRALLFDRERNLLAFPVTIAAIPDAQKKGNDGSAYGSPVFQGAQVYDISLSGGFKLRGSITHYDPDMMLKAGDNWYPYGRDVERILRVGESLISVSQASVQSHDLASVKKNGSVELEPDPGTDPGYPIESY
jgi:uncharacterized secreted protein with C-terminal beta-propeller domain